MLALDHRLGPHERRHEQRRDIALGAPDLDEIAKSRRRQDRDPCAAPLEDGVRSDGGAVDEAPHVAGGDAERGEAGEDRVRLVVRPRRHLRHHHAAGALVDGGEVGERAADVDADDEHGRDDTVRGGPESPAEHEVIRFP